MGSRLVNVRLDGGRLEKARQLRERGIALSTVVREAIDARYEALTGSMTGPRARAIVTRILREHPDPPDRAARPYDVHTARAARAAIVRTLDRRRR